MARDQNRVSGTVFKPQTGFRGELPSIDLATLIQVTCAKRERLVVRVQYQGREGYLYFADGRMVHATCGISAGESAAMRMLAWPAGDFTVVEHPWPSRTSIAIGTEALLIRAAQQRDEATLRAPTNPEQSTVRRAPTRDPAHATLRPPITPPARAAGRGAAESLVLASVRLDLNGELVSAHGDAEMLGAVVAYVTRIGALLGPQLGLAAFEALYAELGARRLVVFVDGSEMVGLVLTPGSTVQELRRQLGV